MKRSNEFNAHYWLARTHAQTWRNRAEIERRERQRHAETVGQAFIGTMAYILVVILFATLAFVAFN